MAAMGVFHETKRAMVREWETKYVTQALVANAGNVSRTAKAMGVLRPALQRKMRELGIKSEWFR